MLFSFVFQALRRKILLGRFFLPVKVCYETLYQSLAGFEPPFYQLNMLKVACLNHQVIQSYL